MTVNVRPAILFALSTGRNPISRETAPFINHRDVSPSSPQSGMGKIVQSFALFPNRPTQNGLIRGAGPFCGLSVWTSWDGPRTIGGVL